MLLRIASRLFNTNSYGKSVNARNQTYFVFKNNIDTIHVMFYPWAVLWLKRTIMYEERHSVFIRHQVLPLALRLQ